jgi:hypothetical protein
MGAVFSSCPLDVTFTLRARALPLALEAFTLLSGGNARLAGFAPCVMRRIVCSL